jgi:hypothetical protein
MAGYMTHYESIFLGELIQIWNAQALLTLPSALLRMRQKRNFWTPYRMVPVRVPESMKGWGLLLSPSSLY